MRRQLAKRRNAKDPLYSRMLAELVGQNDLCLSGSRPAQVTATSRIKLRPFFLAENTHFTIKQQQQQLYIWLSIWFIYMNLHEKCIKIASLAGFEPPECYHRTGSGAAQPAATTAATVCVFSM